MNIKNKIVILVLMVAALSLSSLYSADSALALDPWAQVVKKKCSSNSSPTAVDKCAGELAKKLKAKCDEPNASDKYTKCWRKFITSQEVKPGSAKPLNVPDANPEGCAGVDTAIIKCSQTGEGKNLENNGVWALLLMLIKIMTAGVGILAVAGFGYGAFLWTTAGGNSGQIVKAKETIFNVVVGIVAFALMWAMLQFLIPGGVFEV